GGAWIVENVDYVCAIHSAKAPDCVDILRQLPPQPLDFGQDLIPRRDRLVTIHPESTEDSTSELGLLSSPLLDFGLRLTRPCDHGVPLALASPRSTRKKFNPGRHHAVRNLAVPKGSKSVHPTGHPISHSTHEGFRLWPFVGGVHSPPVAIASERSLPASL